MINICIIEDNQTHRELLQKNIDLATKHWCLYSQVNHQRIQYRKIQKFEILSINCKSTDVSSPDWKQKIIASIVEHKTDMIILDYILKWGLRRYGYDGDELLVDLKNYCLTNEIPLPVILETNEQGFRNIGHSSSRNEVSSDYKMISVDKTILIEKYIKNLEYHESSSFKQLIVYIDTAIQYIFSFNDRLRLKASEFPTPPHYTSKQDFHLKANKEKLIVFYQHEVLAIIIGTDKNRHPAILLKRNHHLKFYLLHLDDGFQLLEDIKNHLFHYLFLGRKVLYNNHFFEKDSKNKNLIYKTHNGKICDVLNQWVRIKEMHLEYIYNFEIELREQKELEIEKIKGKKAKQLASEELEKANLFKEINPFYDAINVLGN